MDFLTRAAALVSGDGYKLQAILDAMYFHELNDFELVAVITPDKNTKAMKRAASSKVPCFAVEPELFPNMTSHSMAVANKLKDLDIDLVILAGYNVDLGVIPYQFKNQMIGTFPSLIPAFDEPDGDIFRAALERGIKITGATSYFADHDGAVGAIISQQAIAVHPDDTPETLCRRVMEEGEWKLLTQAVSLFCQGRLSIHGSRVMISDEAK